VTAARPIDRFWEGFFGTRLEPGVHVVPHVALAGYAGVWLFAREASCIVWAPPDWCGVLERAFGNSTVASVLSPDGFRAVCADALENGKLVIYQTLQENERAVGIARRLGFSFYASHIAVRLLQA
jgi:hypothetical protein